MNKTYEGTCHCGAVGFDITVDLAQTTSRCNCSICSKLRLWKVMAPVEQFRLARGRQQLTDYRFGSRQVLHQFCKVCGVKLFGYVQVDGQSMVVVSVASLDQVTGEELAGAAITYQDGRHDAFNEWPAVTSCL